MKLNPKKYIFRLRLGNFSGFMISHKGIKTYPGKVRELLDMKSTHNIKGVQ